MHIGMTRRSGRLRGASVACDQVLSERVSSYEMASTRRYEMAVNIPFSGRGLKLEAIHIS